MDEVTVIDVTYSVYDTVEQVKDLFAVVDKTISCDFETANRFTDEQKARMNSRLDKATTQYKKRLLQRINADGLSHPSLVNITHFQFSFNDHESHIIITLDKEIRRLVYEFLVTTEVTQIWHNAGFDFKHIYHNTGQFPKHYEDTQLLAKALLNNANEFLGKTGLKELMGYCYNPKWKELADSFENTDPYSAEFLEYCAIDSAATYKLWRDIHVTIS